MENNKLTFEVKGVTISIDYNLCEPVKTGAKDPSCGFGCVKACRWYGRNALKVQNDRPVLTNSNPKELIRLCNECLGCEYDCNQLGSKCISITLSVPGLAEYRRKHNLT